MIQERNRKTAALPKVHIFETFFYPTLADETRGYQFVKNWTKSVDLLSYDLLLVPIHTPGGIGHWSVAVVFVEDQSIKHYDSTKTTANSCLPILLRYLQQWSQDKGNCTVDMSNWSLISEQGLPSQENGVDCGVFCCKFADFIASKTLVQFDQSAMPFFRKLMVFEVIKGSLWSFANTCHVCKGAAIFYDGAKTRGRPKKNSKPGFPCSSCRSLVHLSCMKKSEKEPIYGIKSFVKVFICESCQNGTVSDGSDFPDVSFVNNKDPMEIIITSHRDQTFLTFDE